MNITQQILIGAAVGFGTGFLTRLFMTERRPTEVMESEDGQYYIVLFNDGTPEYFKK